ncbi:MAG: flippase-like domain-containing protein [Candidatus Polarisedimenticolaceae bacterium]|nr:flippase-like domain-containing protein [Candidatus Polarisedimenticolaceae bacterium]
MAHEKMAHPRLVRSLIFSVLAATVIYGLSVISSDLGAVSASSAKFGWSAWLLVLALSLVNYLLRFVRWQLYIKQFSDDVPLLANLTYYLAGFAFTTTPGKAGEAVRSLYLKRHGVAYTHSLAAFFTERFIDLITMVLLSLFAAIAFPDFRWPVLWVAALFVGLLPLIHSMKMHRFLEQLRLRIPSEKIKSMGERLLVLLRSAADLLKAGPLYSGLALGLIAWGSEGVAFYIILDTLGVSSPFGVAIGIYSISVLIGALSFIPGGLGSTEAVMVLLLTLIGADMPTAIAATLICRITTLWFAVIIGAISMAILELQDKQRQKQIKL